MWTWERCFQMFSICSIWRFPALLGSFEKTKKNKFCHCQVSQLLLRVAHRASLKPCQHTAGHHCWALGFCLTSYKICQCIMNFGVHMYSIPVRVLPTLQSHSGYRSLQWNTEVQTSRGLSLLGQDLQVGLPNLRFAQFGICPIWDSPCFQRPNLHICCSAAVTQESELQGCRSREYVVEALFCLSYSRNSMNFIEAFLFYFSAILDPIQEYLKLNITQQNWMSHNYFRVSV